MFENLKAGWAAASATRKALFEDKRLFLFPVLSVLVMFLEAIAIFGSFFLASIGLGFHYAGAIAALFVFYIVTVFTSTYLLMALLISFRAFTQKKPMSFSNAMSQTAQYSILILEWAVFYSIIIMVLRLIESRMRGIGSLIIGVIGSFAIAIATMFAVQVILDDRVGPIKAVETSVSVIKNNFGATFGGLAYSDLYGMIFSVAGIILIVIGAAVAGASVIIGVAVLGIGIVLFALGSLLTFITSNAFKLVLYDYIKGRPLPDGFTKALMDSTIIRKKGQGPGQQSDPNTKSLEQ